MDKLIIQKEVTTMFKMVGETTRTSRVEFSNQNQPTAKVTFVDTPQQKRGLVKGHVILVDASNQQPPGRKLTSWGRLVPLKSAT